jgi:hypothetical protein
MSWKMLTFYSSRLCGFLGPAINPEWFITSQMPFTYTTATRYAIFTNVVATDQTAKLLAQQLGNTYLLLGLLGTFILNTTSELKVVHAYLWALWLGDIGHVGYTVYHMGWEGTLAFKSWSAAAWGNVAFTMFLFAMRSLYFLGAFSTTTADLKARGKELKHKVEAETKKGK